MSFALRHPVLGGTGFFLPANGGTFVSGMAGAGVKRGVACDESDEWSWKGTQQATTTYDVHASAASLAIAAMPRRS